MAGATPTLPVIFLGLVLLASCSGTVKMVTAEWCVARDSASNQQLQNNLNFVCARVNCAIIGSGGPCFFPNTLQNHASVVMNLYYKANNRNPADCDFNGSANIAITDPSFGTCKYQ